VGDVEKDEITLAFRVSDKLAQLCVFRTEPDKNFFPTTAMISIVPGSYVMEMTTQEGRAALVFFPPGPQSLEDIEYMLGGTEEPPAIHTLMRVVTSHTGGIKCLLHNK
jgi:hypothetical protein